MYPEQPLSKQTGAGLPIAIFIVTVLSLIVLSMSQLQQSAGKAISLQIQSQRAFFAAESGAQLVLARIMPADKSDPVTCPETLPDPIDVSFSAGGLANCTASISCKALNPVVTIESNGSCGAGIDMASRTVKISLR